LKRFDFEAKLQRMSVIVKNMQDKSFRAYVKGSPEKIAELCL
jgi:magnesium-transporting ATPase (P-type)